jgi:hypothetical protein
MYCFVMQAWTTIRGQSTVTTINQTENCWLDLSPYQDIVAWLDCKEVSAGTGGTNVQIAYQTAPTKDDSLFVSVVAAANVATGVATTIMLKDVVANPLGRWLRWQLTVTGSPSTAWDATFRVFIAANIVGRRGRAKAGSAMRATRAPSVSGPANVASSAPSTPLHLQSSSFSYGTAVPALNVGYTQQQPAAFSTGTLVPSKPSTFG